MSNDVSGNPQGISDISNNLFIPQLQLIYPEITQQQISPKNVLLIDNTVPSYQTFVDSANTDTFPIVYSKDCSQNELLSVLRSSFTSFERIGFVFTSPGNQPAMFLENNPFFDVLSNGISTSTQFVIDIIREFSVTNMDFLACDTLNYPVWQTYYDLLAQSTGVIVGASDNKTGNLKYGGDWILESTSQDIETVYFTQSIEYYQYLLDTIPFVNAAILKISGLGTDGTYLYCGSSCAAGGVGAPYSNTINRISIANPTLIDRQWSTFTPGGVLWQFSDAYNGNLFFVVNGSSDTYYKLNTTTATSTGITVSGLGNANGITLYNGYLYISSSNNKIYKVSATTGAIDTTWGTSGYVTFTSIPFHSGVTDDGYLYIANANGGVSRLNLNNVTDISNNFKFNGASVTTFLYGAFTVYKNYLYASESSKITKVNLKDFTDIVQTWKTKETSYNYNYNSVSATYYSIYIEGLVGYNYVLYAGMNVDPIETDRRPSSYINAYNLPIPPTNPIGSVSFDVGNTISKSSGNLQVAIIDPSNVSTNNVYYWYSTNGSTYINSNIANNGPTQTTYTINISGLSSSVSTIYIYAKNTLGNTTPISTPVIILGPPTSITSYSTSFSLYTGIQVTVNDTNNRSSNNIYYYYYYFRTGDTAPNQSNNIAVYSNSYVTLTSGSTTNNFYIQNLIKGDYTVYVAAVNAYGANIYTPAMPPVPFICFKEDSRILTNKGYKKIQHLKKGDLVKTFRDGFKPIHQIGKKKIDHTPTTERSKNHLYKCSTSQYPELFEDLVLTGCHSILVDDFVDDEQIRKTEETLGSAEYITDNKYRLPVCADWRASIYEKAGKYMVYHIALENDDYYMNYGIYANGLLVESTSKRFLDQFPIMEI